MSTDRWVAVSAVGAYFALTWACLPPSQYLRGLGGAALVFGAVALVAQVLGRGPVPAPSMLAVAVAAGAVLVFPTFSLVGAGAARAITFGFAGMEIAMLLWAVLRWRPRHRPHHGVRLGTALWMGTVGAAGFSGMATIPVVVILVLGAVTRRPQLATILLIFAAYFVGFVSAGALYWVLQRVRHLASGRFVIGAVGGMCIYGAVAPVVLLFDGRPVDLKTVALMGVISGSLGGPAFALSVDDGPPAV